MQQGKTKGSSAGAGMGRHWMEVGERMSRYLRELLTLQASQASQLATAFFVGALSSSG